MANMTECSCTLWFVLDILKKVPTFQLLKSTVSYIAEVHNNSSSSVMEIPDVDGSTCEYELWIMYYTVLWITHI